MAHAGHVNGGTVRGLGQPERQAAASRDLHRQPVMNAAQHPTVPHHSNVISASTTSAAVTSCIDSRYRPVNSGGARVIMISGCVVVAA